MYSSCGGNAARCVGVVCYIYRQTGESYLKADYHLSCTAPERVLWVALALAMLAIYAIGVPCLYFYLLYRKRKVLHPSVERVLEQLDVLKQKGKLPPGDNFDPVQIMYVHYRVVLHALCPLPLHRTSS